MKIKKFIFIFILVGMASSMLFASHRPGGQIQGKLSKPGGKSDGNGGLVAALPAAKFNPAGDRVSASNGKVRNIWSCPSGALITSLKGHTGDITAAAFNLIGGLVKGKLSKPGGKPDGDGGLVAALPVAKFNPAGDRVFASNGKVGNIWSCPSGALIASLKGHTGDITAAAFNLTGGLVVTGSGDKTAKIWNPETGDLLATLTGHKRGIRAVAFSPNGAYIVTSSDDKLAKIWDAEGNWKKDLPHSSSVAKIAFNQAGTVLATADFGGKIKMWNFEEGEDFGTQLGDTYTHADTILTWIEFSPSDELFISAGKDAIARLWSWSNTEKTASLLYELQHGDPVPSRITSSPFSPDSAIVVTTSKDSLVKLWYTATGDNFKTFDEHTSIVESAQFNQAGNFVTASYDKTAKTWYPGLNNSLKTLRGHTQGLRWAEYDSSGTYIVTGAHDGTAKIWNANTGACLATLPPPN